MIGGRIVPSFTRNWLARENPGRLPAPFGRFDVVAIARQRRGAGAVGRAAAGRLAGRRACRSPALLQYRAPGALGRRPHRRATAWC